MSLLKSLNEPYVKTEEVSGNTHQSWMVQVVEILIKEKSQLLAEVELGKVNQTVLEMEVVKIMDRLKLMGNRSFHLKKLKDYMFGYGILQPYLENENVSDIIVSRFDYICAKEKGVVRRLPIAFENEASFERYLKLIITRNGGMLNENDSHARVSDETLRLRINAVIPPRSSTGPFLAIRKHRKVATTLETLLEWGFVNEKVQKMVEEIALSEARVLICGKGGAGKTTLLRAILNVIGEKQRLMICESDAEIFPESSSMVGQKINEKSLYGNQVTLNDLVKDGLTMTMDGYCIGEITGKEAWSFVKAGYTDHRVLGTIHSKGAEDALDRMLMLSEIHQLGISEETAKMMIKNAVDYVIYVKSYHVEEIWQYSGLNEVCLYKWAESRGESCHQ